MLRCYWIFIAAIGLAVPSSAGSQSPESAVGEQSDSHRDGASSQREPLGFSLPVRILEEPGEAENAERQQHESAQREIEDLIAQQSMARSTEEIVLWTQLQFAIAFLGTGALLYSLYLNRKATLAAVEAASLAREAISVERAWVTYLQHSLIDVTDSVVGEIFIREGILISLHWQNSGRTPAVEVECHFKFAMMERDDTEFPVFELETFENPPLKQSAVIGPGGDFETNYISLDDEQTRSFVRGEKRLALYSRVSYRDIFHPQETRYSEVAFDCRYHGKKKDNDGREMPHVSFHPTGPQNTAS